jgi:hypothetical protein
MTSKTRCAAASAAIFGALACGAAAETLPDSAVLATVDGEAAVTVADVLYYLEKNRAGLGERPATTEGDVAEAVDKLVTAEVLILEAEAAGYGDIPAVAERHAAFRAAELREGLRKTLLAEDPVSEEELRTFYEKDSKWRKCAEILCKNRKEAERARSELDAGAPWEEVWARYSIDKDNFPEPGTRDLPVFYDGREASAAAFNTPVGQYAPPAPANDNIRWRLFRVDKIVHGRIDTFEEASPGLRTAVGTLKTLRASRELVAELRRSVPVDRNEEMWDDLQNRPFADFRQKWGTGAAVVSAAGGVPVYGRDYVPLITDFLCQDDAGLDEYRARDPDDFAYVTDRILAQLEDEAFLEYEAVARGLDRDPSFARASRNHRAELLTDILINREFLAGLPPLSEADLRRYYDEHPEQFQVPEMAECYLVALPDAELVRAFRSRVRGGESIVDVGEGYNRKRGRELADAYDAPPRLPPEKEDFVRAVSVLRQPEPQEREFPLVADLRTRIFDRPEPGTLSDVFQLADGRWAFYEVTYYRPPGKEDFTLERIRAKCRELAWTAYLQSEEANDRAAEWLAALRAKHTVAYAPDLYAGAAAVLR